MNQRELDVEWLRLADIRRRMAKLRAELVQREPTFTELLMRWSRDQDLARTTRNLRRKLH